jgi:hypothetical protein
MLNKVTVVGEYIGQDPRGTIIGGKLFLPNCILETEVTEEVFNTLKIAEENKWFRIDKHNYNEFLKERNIVIEEPTVQPVIEEPVVVEPTVQPVVEEVVIEPVVEEVVVEEVAKTTKKTAKKKNDKEVAEKEE